MPLPGVPSRARGAHAQHGGEQAFALPPPGSWSRTCTSPNSRPSTLGHRFGLSVLWTAPRSHGRQLRLSLPPRHHTHARTGCGASAHRCTSTGSPPTATQGHGPARGRLAGTSRHHHRHRSPATAATHPADTPRPALASLWPSTVRHAPAPTSGRRTNTPIHPKADAFEEHGAPTTQRTRTAR